MIKEEASVNITNYSFLELLVSNIILQDNAPIFENQQLQKDLYKFYNNLDFYFLFEDVTKRESIEGENYVELQKAFSLAYTWGLLSMIEDNDNLKSFINLSKEEALENMRHFTPRQTKAMSNLVSRLYKQKKDKKSHVLIKK